MLEANNFAKESEQYQFFQRLWEFGKYASTCEHGKLYLEIKDAKKAMAVSGSYLDVFTALMCTQLQIRYEKLSEQERTVLKNVMKKTPACEADREYHL